MLPVTGPEDWRLCVWHAPAPGVRLRGLVLQVHAFAEEMNKSRRMCARQARALAAQGFAVLQLDLHGCGDSAGEFGQTSWMGWLDDVLWAAKQLRARADPQGSGVPMWLWGHRVGALLASAAAARLAEMGQPCHLLLWQPVTQGALALKQFLRLRAAAGLLDSTEPREGPDALLKRLRAGETLDVAGYALAPALALGLEGARLEPGPMPGRVVWLELSHAEPPTPSPAAVQAAARWQAAGWSVEQDTVRGPAFWQTTEIEDAPALLEATSMRLVRDTVPASPA